MARTPQLRRLPPAGGRPGFTLIELILVLGLLAVILTVSTPTLSNFFMGRRAREEARRFLALTRFARMEAVSRSTPMELWVEADRYGLRERLTGDREAKDVDATDRPREYQVAEGLKLECENGQRTSRGRVQILNQGTILFQPDGTIDEDECLERVMIVETTERNMGREFVIERNEVGVGFVVLDEDEARIRRR